jgi:hypothetical protein
VLGALIIGSGSSDVFACRPFATEDAGVAGRNIAQLEVSYDHTHCGDESDEGQLMFVPIYGVNDRLELSAEIPVGVQDRSSGIGDIILAAKYSLGLQTGARPAVSAKAFIKTASGNADAELGSGVAEYGAAVVASAEYGLLTLHLVSGLSTAAESAAHSTVTGDLGLGSQYRLSNRWTFAGELTASWSDLSSGAEPEASAMAGFIWQVSDALAIDAGYRIGFTDPALGRSVTFGISLSQ